MRVILGTVYDVYRLQNEWNFMFVTGRWILLRDNVTNSCDGNFILRDYICNAMTSDWLLRQYVI